jgi:hypothetical protein
LALAGVILFVFGAKLLLIRSFGSPVPNYDQWQSQARLLYIPFFDHYLKAKYFWVPHNEHRVLFTRLLNFFLTLSNGQWDTRLEMTVNAAIHAGFAGGLVAFASKLVRGWGLVAVTAIVVALFSLPCAWENTLGGFQSQFYFLCWTALGQIWLCATAESLSRRWWCGYGVGLLALGTMASGFFSSGIVLVVMWLRNLCARQVSRRDWMAALLLMLVCAAGVILTHRTEASAAYWARSLSEWLRSAAYAFGWPFGRAIVGVLVFQAPMALLAADLVLRRRTGKWNWALLGLGIWTWVQLGCLALTRSAVIDASPKYTDIFAISLIANSVALLVLAGRRNLAGTAIVLWLGLLGAGLSMATKQAIGELGNYRVSETAKADHIRAYVETGNFASLGSVPAKELPYTDASYLARMLSHPGIRPLLPRELQAPSAWEGYGPDSKVSNVLQQEALWILGLGLLLAAFGVSRMSCQVESDLENPPQGS